jgi:hypothetical protein
MKLDELTLDSGVDIPFGAAGVTIHVPTLEEIGYIGEEDFLIGCHFLLLDKNNLEVVDKSGLDNQSNFHIFMSVMNSSDKAKHKTDVILVLTLLFPNYKVKIEHDKILLQLENFSSSINETNFNEFQDIIAQMFCLGGQGKDGDYNPADALAKRIADKLKKSKEKRAKAKGQDIENVSIYGKYISILAVGLRKDKNELKEYTIPQLRDEFERFTLKQEFDTWFKAKLAGAQNLEEVKNWMEDL